MDRNILLTYRHKDGYHTFEWFEDIEECNDFVESYIDDMIIKILDCVDCSNCIDMMSELHYTPNNEEE